MHKHIGILGGTFNPIHIGHLAMAEVIRQDRGLEKIIFIPAGNPPHKSPHQVVSALHRYEMVRLAIKDNDYFEVDDVEINRKGKTYTIDTLLQLKERYLEQYKIDFIIGTDTLFEIEGWKAASDVVKLCNLIVYSRPGFYLDSIKQKAYELTRDMQASIYFTEGPALDISSTEIRQRITLNKSVRYLVPYEVDEYINKHGLYRGVDHG